jgi:ABC-type multidrug transport system permease subunit
MSPYVKRSEWSQINDQILQIKLLEKQEQVNPKTSRREIIKVRAEINKIQTKKSIQRINETKSWFFIFFVFFVFYFVFLCLIHSYQNSFNEATIYMYILYMHMYYICIYMWYIYICICLLILRQGVAL